FVKRNLKSARRLASRTPPDPPRGRRRPRRGENLGPPTPQDPQVGQLPPGPSVRAGFYYGQFCRMVGCRSTRPSVMPNNPRTGRSLLSALPEHLSKDLFASAKPVRVAADEVLFLAGDKGDGCYRIEEGLLKVTMVSRAGNERILAFFGPSAIVGELSIIDGLPRSA